MYFKRPEGGTRILLSSTGDHQKKSNKNPRLTRTTASEEPSSPVPVPTPLLPPPPCSSPPRHPLSEPKQRRPGARARAQRYYKLLTKAEELRQRWELPTKPIRLAKVEEPTVRPNKRPNFSFGEGAKNGVGIWKKDTETCWSLQVTYQVQVKMSPEVKSGLDLINKNRNYRLEREKKNLCPSKRLHVLKTVSPTTQKDMSPERKDDERKKRDRLKRKSLVQLFYWYLLDGWMKQVAVRQRAYYEILHKEVTMSMRKMRSEEEEVKPKYDEWREVYHWPLGELLMDTQRPGSLKDGFSKFLPTSSRRRLWFLVAAMVFQSTNVANYKDSAQRRRIKRSKS